MREAGVRSVIVVTPAFERVWPFAADHLHALWRFEGAAELIRSASAGLVQLVPDPGTVTRLISLAQPVALADLDAFGALEEAVLYASAYGEEVGEEVKEALERRGVTLYRHGSVDYWGQSVAEFALALTLCALRRIPQTYRQMLSDLSVWDYSPPGGVGKPGERGEQFGDDPRFASGTLEGKRLRVVGMGNIGSRYASFAHALGAEVAAWDPYASDPCFHRAGARREFHLTHLAQDAEIFAPMLPLSAATRGLVTRELLERLPTGCLVVLATRANICDMPALRQRVLADELSLAADVFDTEPLPLDDPLLGRHNVVHTPHNAGRTKEANHRFAEQLVRLFKPP